jgi:hypothetical protein
LRRLVAQIERKTGGRHLSLRGRQYKLVVGEDLTQTPGRDLYEVVGHDDAQAVLEGLAEQSATSAELLRKASDKLSKDWRAPFSHPDGLVLLRRIPAQVQVPKPQTETITPSQMAKLASEPVTLEVVVLGLDDKPLDGISYVIESPDSESYEGDLGSSGQTKITSAKKGSAGVALDWSDAGSKN